MALARIQPAQGWAGSRGRHALRRRCRGAKAPPESRGGAFGAHVAIATYKCALRYACDVGVDALPLPPALSGGACCHWHGLALRFACDARSAVVPLAPALSGARVLSLTYPRIVAIRQM